MYYYSMLLVILASVFYHISQKSINTDVNPIISLVATYGVAIILSGCSLVFIKDKQLLGASFKSLNWASYALGAVIFLLEIGFILVYRSGWKISVAPIFANVTMTLVLIVVGLFVFKENVDAPKLLGIILSAVGLILMTR